MTDLARLFEITFSESGSDEKEPGRHRPLVWKPAKQQADMLKIDTTEATVEEGYEEYDGYAGFTICHGSED
jgi:hypothetical protein